MLLLNYFLSSKDNDAKDQNELNIYREAVKRFLSYGGKDSKLAIRYVGNFETTLKEFAKNGVFISNKKLVLGSEEMNVEKLDLPLSVFGDRIIKYIEDFALFYKRGLDDIMRADSDSLYTKFEMFADMLLKGIKNLKLDDTYDKLYKIALKEHHYMEKMTLME